VGFSAGIANAMFRGLAPDCHCFGQLHSSPVGWRALGRNLALLGVAGFVAVGGWSSPGTSATGWLTGASPAVVVGVAASVVIVLLVGFQVWFSLQLLAQNGRVLDRLGKLEATMAALGESDGGQLELGAGLSGGGLPIGAVAPDFSLPAVDGELRSLGSLLADGLPLMLIFAEASCGPCDALMPEVTVWQREHAAGVQFVVLASGDEGRNRAKAREHGLARVLLQRDGEVSSAYEAHGTPMAVMVGSDGRIESPAVGGADAIRTLVSQATSSRLAIRQVRPRNGNGSAPSRRRSPSERIGQPAPELVLKDLDGNLVALKELYSERTVAIFWNPGCGFCEAMLRDLRSFEENPPADGPQVVVISGGDVDHVAEQRLRSRVLLDSDSAAMNAFGAAGTPMGVMIEHGLIVSPVAVGADAVFELLQGHSGPDVEASGDRSELGPLA
jgi:peroxiredoxin